MNFFNTINIIVWNILYWQSTLGYQFDVQDIHQVFNISKFALDPIVRPEISINRSYPRLGLLINELKLKKFVLQGIHLSMINCEQFAEYKNCNITIPELNLNTDFKINYMINSTPSKYKGNISVQFKGVLVEVGNILDGSSMFKDIEFIVKNIKTAHFNVEIDNNQLKSEFATNHLNKYFLELLYNHQHIINSLLSKEFRRILDDETLLTTLHSLLLDTDTLLHQIDESLKNFQGGSTLTWSWGSVSLHKPVAVVN
ncbi:uncharacterized protein LOC109598348 [Aethina tumida]|uniref:uncharacterized protein LOC109598348 n=1 Tax=Aethina tumida TaxID=116153 RepID=UPI002148A31F|nr:uncharacterized protein LOC109598348 [Aethina tumida]